MTASDLLILACIQRSDKKIQASVRVHDEVGVSVREPIWSYLPRFKISTSWVWMSKPLQIRLGFLNNIDIVDLFSIIGFIIPPPRFENRSPEYGITLNMIFGCFNDGFSREKKG